MWTTQGLGPFLGECYFRTLALHLEIVGLACLEMTCLGAMDSARAVGLWHRGGHHWQRTQELVAEALVSFPGTTFGALSPCLAAPAPGEKDYITLGQFMRECHQRFADTALLGQTIRDTIGRRLYKQLADAPCICTSELYGLTNGAASMLQFMFRESCLKSSLAALMTLSSNEHLCCRTTHRSECPIDPTCLAGEIQTWLVLRDFRCYILDGQAPEWLEDFESETEDDCSSDDFESDDDGTESESLDEYDGAEDGSAQRSTA